MSLTIILNIIRPRQSSMGTILLFETLLIDDFSTDRLVYDKIANIEARESKLINISKEYSMKYMIEQKRNIRNVCLVMTLFFLLMHPNYLELQWNNLDIN